MEGRKGRVESGRARKFTALVCFEMNGMQHCRCDANMYCEPFNELRRHSISVQGLGFSSSFFCYFEIKEAPTFTYYRNTYRGSRNDDCLWYDMLRTISETRSEAPSFRNKSRIVFSSRYHQL